MAVSELRATCPMRMHTATENQDRQAFGFDHAEQASCALALQWGPRFWTNKKGGEGDSDGMSG
jgi:hypothetical protein